MEPVASTSASAREAASREASVSTGEATDNTEKANWRWLGVRHLQVALLFLSQVIAGTHRFNISVTIVAMVDKQGANPDYPEYAWSLATQAVILSAYNWGHLILQVPGGLLAKRFGPKLLVGGVVLASSLLTIVTPLAADVGGAGLVFAVRLLVGLVQGALNPASFVQLVSWSPVGERGKFNALVFSGVHMGNVVALSAGGVMSTGSGGWPSLFYWFGGIGIVWTALWMWLGADTPALDRHISAQERAYIQDSLQTKDNIDKRLATPWKAILTSGPMWAIIAANIGHSWGFFTLSAELPTYMKDILGFNLQENGALSALPWLVTFIAGLVLAITSDSLTNRKVISLTLARKIFNTIGLWMPCLALILLCSTTGADVAVELLVIAVGCNAGILLGFHVNYVDLSPNFAGALMGLSYTAGNIIASFSPLLVGVVVLEEDSVSQWRIVFYITAAFYFLAGLFYMQFASAELQQWNDPPLQDRESAETDSLIPSTPTTSYYTCSSQENMSGFKSAYSSI